MDTSHCTHLPFQSQNNEEIPLAALEFHRDLFCVQDNLFYSPYRSPGSQRYAPERLSASDIRNSQQLSRWAALTFSSIAIILMCGMASNEALTIALCIPYAV